VNAETLIQLPAARAAEAIQAGDLTSEALVGACLERIAERDATVRAWEHIDRDAALAQARARDAETPRGPLHGVPVGIKDLIDTADQPTSYGTPIYAGHHPDRDAACVARLRGAGAVILGKTVTTEFALFHPGPTTNPHDPQRTPGGSSSGSAAAVADGMVPLALGTQTAASVSRPAAFCGVFGFKPTYGVVPTDGVKPASPSLDTIGVFARGVDDLALWFEVMTASPAGGDAQPRMAWTRTYEWDRADAWTQRALLAVADRLGLPELAPPDEFEGLVAAQTAIMEAEVASSLAPEQREHPHRLSAELRDLLARGARVTDRERASAHDLATRSRALLPDVFAHVDVLLAPSVIGEAPVGLDATGDPLFGRIWTLLGTPTVAVPGLRGPNGMPLGVQVVAAPGNDGAALAAARWLAPRLAEMPQ
jgi:amidase